MESTDRGLIRHMGPFAVDLPRSTGYFGGVGLAVAAGLIEPPLGLFVAAVPFLHMLNRPSAPRAARMVGQLFEGMAKPVGGDSEGTVQLAHPSRAPRPVRPAVGAPRQRRSRKVA